ncbi:hypothetical protein [Streptomyces sp. HUAS TT3]|uniref:hypothetical protein n=1 Tax=Streptomyces sp. HUAS TT3 TaxID=3447510 RepID=UPI003F6594E8
MSENIAPDEHERLRVLETQVQVLAQAVKALAKGLEEIPSEEVERERQAAHGARLAHELLLAQGL